MSLGCFYLHCGVNHEGGWCRCPVPSLSYTSSMHKQIFVEIKIKTRRKNVPKRRKKHRAMGGCHQLLWRWRLRQRCGLEVKKIEKKTCQQTCCRSLSDFEWTCAKKRLLYYYWLFTGTTHTTMTTPALPPPTTFSSSPLLPLPPPAAHVKGLRWQKWPKMTPDASFWALGMSFYHFFVFFIS